MKRSRKIGHIAQKDNKLVVALRNSIMKHMPKRFLVVKLNFYIKQR